MPILLWINTIYEWLCRNAGTTTTADHSVSNAEVIKSADHSPESGPP